MNLNKKIKKIKNNLIKLIGQVRGNNICVCGLTCTCIGILNLGFYYVMGMLDLKAEDTEIISNCLVSGAPEFFFPTLQVCLN